MTRGWRRYIPLGVALALAACAAEPAKAVVDRVPVAPGVTLALSAAAELGRSMDAVQLVTARRGDETFVFEGRISIDDDGLMLVGTDAMGRRAMTLRWSGGRLAVERAAWLPDSLPPENILADLMLLFWPEDSLRRHLSGAVLEQAPDGRRIRRDGADLVVVRYQGDPWSGTAQLDNLSWGYRIEIRSMRVAP